MTSKLNPVQRALLINALRTKHQEDINGLEVRRDRHLEKLMDATSEHATNFHRNIARSLRDQIQQRTEWFESMLEVLRAESQ